MRFAAICRAFRVVLPALILSSVIPVHASPTVGTIYPSASPKVNKRFELTFTLTGILPKGQVFPTDGNVGYNPFWQETTTSGPIPTAPGVKVWAVITAPDGSTFTLDGFYCVEYEFLGDSRSGYDRIVPINHPQTRTAEHWHVRFIPTQVGAYTATVYADDSDPTTPATTATGSFIVAAAASGDHGVLRVSTDGQRLEFSDGTPYCQLGFMMQQGCQAVAYWPQMNGKKGLEVLANAGGNFIRRWIVNTQREDVYRGISWHRSDDAFDSTEHRTGSYCAKVTIGGTEMTLVDRSFLGCKGGRTYISSIWFKGGDGNTGRVRMCVNEDNDTVETPHLGPWVDISNKDWRQATLTFTTAADAKWLHFKPQSDGGHGDLYLDDMDLRDRMPGSAVDYNMIQNPSFEDWSPVQLDTANLWRTDYCLKKCEDLGIKVQLCLFDYRLWNSIDPKGFYYNWFGDQFWGDSSSGTWQETDCVRQEKRAMRYLAARYGGFPSLGLWELTNEMSPWYSGTAYAWLKEMSRYLQSVDLGFGGQSNQRPVTNSYWFSPADAPAYEQIPNMKVSSVHTYLYTNTHPQLKNRVPGFGMNGNTIDSTGYVSSPNAYHVAVNYPSETAEDVLIGRSFGTHPGKRYKLVYSVKLGPATGSAPAFRAHYFRHDAQKNTLTEVSQATSPPTNWVQKQMTWTAGPLDALVSIRFELVNILSCEVWLDDVKLLESSDGITWQPILYNSDFSITNLSDDEVTWALYSSSVARGTYTAGPNGCDKAYLFGETGLFDWSSSQNGWVFSRYADLDTTGIHSHNIVWAQVMASGAVNSPCYWFSQEYMVNKAAAGIDVYTPTWKGIFEFIKVLPFRSGSQLISTDLFFSQVGSVTSNSAWIRVVGQKKEDTAYFWVSNNSNTWCNRIQNGGSPVATDATVFIPGFTTGAYNIANYDSYTGALISETPGAAGADGILRVAVQGLATDTAFIVSPQSSQSLHPLYVPDGSTVDLLDMSIVSDPTDWPGAYAEHDSRAWGVRFVAPPDAGVWLGARAHIRGTLRTADGQRYLEIGPDGEYTQTDFGRTAGPVMLATNKMLGGVAQSRYVPAIKDAFGLYNVGLFVHCIGKVITLCDDCFYIDDGSKLSDGSGYTGIRVQMPPQPYDIRVDDYVDARGMSSTIILNNQVVRVLRPRASYDVRVSYRPLW